MQNRSGAPTDSGQSPLSLLVSAAEGRNQSDASGRGGDASNAIAGASLADQLRLRSAQEGGPSLEEQLLLQQQAQQQQQASNFGNNAALLGLRDPNLLQQLSGAGQNPQLAALLGLGGGGGGDLRQALAAHQLRQAAASNQLSHADILALSRSGALGGAGAGSLFGGALGGMGALGAAAAAQAGLGSGTGGLASELESLQRLEEIERRQRLMAAGADPLMGNTAAAVQAAREQQQQLANQVHQQQQAQLQAQQAARMQSQEHASVPGVRGPVIRDERIPGGHIPRPNLDSSTNSKKDGAKAAGAAAPMKTSNLTSDEAQAAAAMVAASGGKVIDDKEELEKTPGSVIVPCRARGMPMDHNFKTAYFVIPENVKHGEELICSYFACRNAGIKFRYCSHCKVPVAKRNFRKRHKHGGNDVAQLPGDEDSGAEEDVPSKRAGIPSQITAKPGMEADALSSNSAQSHDKEEIQQGLVRNSIRNLEQQQAAKAASAPPSASAAMASPEDDNPKITAERRNRWASLLGRRPATKDGDSMSGWLMEVLAVSDLDTPLKPSEDMNGKPKADLSAVAKVASAMAAQKKDGDQKEPAASSASAAGIVKKKRPADFMPSEDVASASDATPQKGSYAAWKERKKQKNKRNVKPKTEDAES